MPLDPVSTAAEAVQFGYGLVNTISGQTKAKRLTGQRTTYKTPQEVYKILEATQGNAGTGLDPATLQFLTSQTDEAFSGMLGTAERLGGDPNDLSAGFHDKINAIMKIGSLDQEEKMKHFGTYLEALGTLGDNKAAEWKSREDLLKDKIQQAVQQKQEGLQNMGNAVNSFIGTQSASKMGDLYNPDGSLKTIGAAAAGNQAAANAAQFNANNTRGFSN